MRNFNDLNEAEKLIAVKTAREAIIDRIVDGWEFFTDEEWDDVEERIRRACVGLEDERAKRYAIQKVALAELTALATAKAELSWYDELGNRVNAPGLRISREKLMTRARNYIIPVILAAAVK